METTAFVQTTKAEINIVPQETYEILPFIKQEEKDVYKSAPKDPLLKPMAHDRMGELGQAASGNTSIPIYEELVKSLPSIIKDQLASENNKPLLSRNPNYVVLNEALSTTAKFIDWAESAAVPPAPGTPATIQNRMNQLLPQVALKSGIETTANALQSLTSFSARNDEVSSAIKQLNDLVSQLNKGVTEGFKEISNSAQQILESVKKDENRKEFNIVTDMSHMLAVVTASMTSPNPSLLLGTEIANTAQSGTFNTIGKSIVDGLNQSMEFGTRTELNELNDLKGRLQAMGNS